MDRGKLTLIQGPMKSGKSFVLLEMVIARLTMAFLPSVIKPGKTMATISSRDGGCFAAVVVKSSEDVLSSVNYCSTYRVLIDEAHLFDIELADVCVQLRNAGLNVFVAGCDLNFRGEPFETMQAVEKVADQLIICRGRCGSHGNGCGQWTTHSFRTSPCNDIVEVGDHYQPMCEICFKYAMEQRR